MKGIGFQPRDCCSLAPPRWSCAAASAPAVADAAETVIGFDDQATGTVIGNQYSGQGVTFDVKPSGAAELHPTIVEPPAGEPHSSPKALDVSQKCGSEFAEAHMWARFAAPRGDVSIYVGGVEPSEGNEVPITLQGYDLGGNAIPAAKETQNISGVGVNTRLEISDSESDISFVQLTSLVAPICHVAVDDLAFEALPSTIPPDFGLSGPSLATTLTPGASASVPLVLHRNSTSTGPISFSVSGLPTGVSANVNPNPSGGPDGSGLSLELSAKANAPPFSNSLVTVEGVPSAEAGTHNRSVQVPVSVAGNYDLRAQGLEVTQGIQYEGDLKPSGSGESGGGYTGVDLIAHKQTAVRFFADAHGQIGSGIREVGALLYGFSNGRELPGSPLRPDYGPPSTQGGGPGLVSIQENNPAPVLEAERVSNENAYTFTLPVSWTSGTISLRGNVFQEPGFPQPGRRPECSTPECAGNNAFTHQRRHLSRHPDRRAGHRRADGQRRIAGLGERRPRRREAGRPTGGPRLEPAQPERRVHRAPVPGSHRHQRHRQLEQERNGQGRGRARAGQGLGLGDGQPELLDDGARQEGFSRRHRRRARKYLQHLRECRRDHLRSNRTFRQPPVDGRGT